MRQLRELGVIVVALSSSCIDASHGNGLVIGYGAFEPAVIEHSLALIGSVLRGAAAAAPQAHHQAPHQAEGTNR